MWKRRILRYLLPALVFLFACALQTTVWPDWLGTFPPPPLWLLIIIYLSLYRPEMTTILFLYFLGLLASSFTAMPLKMMLFTILIVHIAVAIARERVFWSGVGYFVLAATSSVAVFHVAYWILSHLLEPEPAAWLIWERLAQVLLAIPFAGIVYTVMEFIERPFVTEAPAQTGTP
jgi:cell shape-determining protein MreD